VRFKSFALPEFWKCYDALPENTQALCNKLLRRVK